MNKKDELKAREAFRELVIGEELNARYYKAMFESREYYIKLQEIAPAFNEMWMKNNEAPSPGVFEDENGTELTKEQVDELWNKMALVNEEAEA